MEFKDAVESFIEYLSLQRRVSPETVRAYRSDLVHFLEWLERISGDSVISVEGISHHHILQFLGTKHFGKKSQARKLSTLRSFYRFLEERFNIETNPVEKLLNPKIPQNNPSYVEVDEMYSFLEFLKKKAESGKWLQVRVWALYETLYSTGFRVGEIVKLKEHDIDKEGGFATVIGKGEKERKVPIGRVALDAIDRYLDALARQEPSKRSLSEYLFKNCRGYPLTTRAVHKILQKALREAGASRFVGPHGIRHSFATHLLSSGADIRSIQEMLGHSNLSTTEKYTHIDFGHLASVYDKAYWRSKKE